MRKLVDYRQLNEEAPIDVLLHSDEWKPFVQFMNNWYRTSLGEETGCSTAQLDEAEQKSGRRMPTAMREWYRLIGAHEALREEAQDYEMPLHRVGSESRWLMMFGENQDCWYCGVLNEHCDLPDPPVYFESFGFDPVEDAGYHPAQLVDGKFIHVTDSLVHFAFGMAVRQAVIRLEASPVLKPGVCGAIFQRGFSCTGLIKCFQTQTLLDFPAGFNPAYNHSDIALIEGWGLIARTPAKFAEASQFVRNIGYRLEKPWQVD